MPKGHYVRRSKVEIEIDREVKNGNAAKVAKLFVKNLRSQRNELDNIIKMMEGITNDKGRSTQLPRKNHKSSPESAS